MKLMKDKKNVIVMGGGTGTFTVLQGLKHYGDLILTAVVTSTDSGGSTGRLRDEFGILPIGDVRQCLVALMKDDSATNILRQLFMYRFPDGGSSLDGHNFGNLFLTALTDVLGTEQEAIDAAGKILNIKGRIMPVTTDKVHLVAEYENGYMLFGEAEIDAPKADHDGTSRIKRMWTQPKAQINPDVAEAIAEADYLVLGPGDLYSSLISNLVVDGVAEAIQKSKCKVIYITNLVSKWGQTHGLKNSDYVAEIAKYLGKSPDILLVNNQDLPENILEKYEAEKSYPVIDDLEGEQIIKRQLLSQEEYTRANGDVVKRSLIRHDSERVAAALHEIFVKM
jgi:uncharacterized cofD-like protein